MKYKHVTEPKNDWTAESFDRLCLTGTLCRVLSSMAIPYQGGSISRQLMVRLPVWYHCLAAESGNLLRFQQKIPALTGSSRVCNQTAFSFGCMPGLKVRLSLWPLLMGCRIERWGGVYFFRGRLMDRSIDRPISILSIDRPPRLYLLRHMYPTKPPHHIFYQYFL